MRHREALWIRDLLVACGAPPRRGYHSFCLAGQTGSAVRASIFAVLGRPHAQRYGVYVGRNGRRHGRGGATATAPAQLLLDEHLAQDGGAVVVVLVVVLDEASAVDVDDVALAAGAQEIEAAHALAERGRDLARDLLLLAAQLRHVANLLAVGVAAHDAVDDGRLARLGVAVVWSHRVGLDILGIVDAHELLVDVALAGLGDGAGHDEVLNELGALVADLAEQLAGAAAAGRGEVDDDVVVLAARRLLDEGLLE